MSSITNVNNNASVVNVGRTTPVSPGVQPASKSIPVVIASDQTAIPVEEQNKVQSEVALSLLGIPRAEVALGIFADVNTYDVNPSEWSSSPQYHVSGHGIQHLPTEAGALVEAPRNKTAVLTSKRFFRYQPGRVSAATFGVKSTVGQASFSQNPSIRKFGIYDNFDGLDDLDDEKRQEVIDATQMLAGPIAGTRLGDLGADVIKVEPPTNGEFNRTRGFEDQMSNGEMTTFLAVNRNKRSLAIDLKSAGGKEVIYELVKKSDVFLQNFRYGTADRLGIGYEDLKKINPRIIYCSISGYGSFGPYRDRPGQDLVVQGYSGSMFSVGASGDDPTPSALWGADVMTGYQAVIGILAAVESRHQTGVGQHVEVDMLSVVMDCQLQELVTFLNAGPMPRRLEERSAHGSIPAPYGVQRRMSPTDNRIEDLLSSMKNLPKNPPGLLYISHNESSHKERSGIKELFTGKDWAEVHEKRVSYSVFLYNLSQSKFMICPRGNAIDCHRNWEVLYMRRVPIMKRHPYLVELYKDYPVLFVDDYSDINKELLIDNDYLFQRAQEMDLRTLDLNNFFNKTLESCI